MSARKNHLSLFACATIAAALLVGTQGCAKKPPARDPTKHYVGITIVEGVTRDKVGGVTVPGAKNKPVYREALIPRGTVKWHGSGRRGQVRRNPGELVSGTLQSEKGRAERIYVGVEGRRGYYEFTVPPGKGNVPFDVKIGENPGAEPFTLEIAPEIGGTLRLPFYITVNPASAPKN